MSRYRDEPSAPPPEWAPFFSPGHYPLFVRLVEDELTRRGLRFQMGDGVVFVELQPGQQASPFGLQNLAQKCHMAGGPDAWPDVIAGHFNAMEEGEKHHALIDEIVKDFERVRPLLKVRLFPEDMLEQAPASSLVYRQPADGLLAVLVLDFPTTVATVNDDHRKGWSLDDDTLFDLALQNVATQDPPSVEDIDLSNTGGVPARALTGDSFFIASHLLRIETFLDYVPPRGLVVAVPHRHALIMHPIWNMGVIDAIQTLVPMAVKMFHEGPGSVSPFLYWWQPKRLVALPTTVSDGRIEFHPDPRFVSEVLEPLAQAKPS